MKYKLVNPKRFIAFVTTIVFVVVYITAFFHTKTTTENKNLEISKEVQNSITRNQWTIQESNAQQENTFRSCS